MLNRRNLSQVIFVATLGTLFAHASVAQSNMPWVADINTARQVAQRHDRLILIHFFSDDCPPCQRLEGHVFNRPGFGHGVSQNYVPVKVNATLSPDLARQFRIERWPTDVIVSASGEELHRMVSPQNSVEYLGILNRVAWRARNMVPGVSTQQNMAGYLSSQRTNNSAPAFPATNYQPADNTNPRQQNSYPFAQTSAISGSRQQPDAMTAGLNSGAADQMNRYAATGSAHAGLGPSAVTPTMQSPQMIANPFIKEPATSPPTGEPTISPSQADRNDFAVPPPRPTTTASANPGPSPAGAAFNQGPPTNRQTTREPTKAGLDGFCPVTLLDNDKWIRGDSRWGAKHRGRVYLFQSVAAQQRFLADPDRYSPVLAGYDPVVFAEQGRYVDGGRAHGIRYRNQVFLFQSEETLDRFWNSPASYTAVVRQAMDMDRHRR